MIRRKVFGHAASSHEVLAEEGLAHRAPALALSATAVKAAELTTPRSELVCGICVLAPKL